MAAVTPVCVLRSGGDFTPQQVQWLAAQVPGIVCLSDRQIPGVKTIPLRTDWPGWWAKLEACDAGLIGGDVLLMDLDTVILEMPATPTETTVLRDFTRPELMASGFMFLTAADRAKCWAAFNTDPAKHMRECRGFPRLGDGGFMQGVIGDSAARWGDEVRSYKEHCREGVPRGTKVVCFHGKPRPWQVRAEWIPPLPAEVDFRSLILSLRGKTVCVMGGAQTLTEHLAQVEADVFISTNGHGANLREPAYVVAMDEEHSVLKVPMGPLIRAASSAPVISPRAYADYRLTTWAGYPKTAMLTGMVAAWCAWAMGAKVVILAGMDGYGGKPGAMEMAHIAARDIKCAVRVVGGGSLMKFWKEYNPMESIEAVDPHPSIEALQGVDGLTTIEVKKPVTIGLINYPKGARLTVMRHDVDRLIRHRMVEEVAANDEEPINPTTKPPQGMRFMESSTAVVAAIEKPRGKPGRKPKESK